MPQLAAPKQARSRRTLERIVNAGLALLEEGGADAVTVQAVVARAGSSVGSFYARFRGKEDLLAHLREHVRTSAEAEWSETLEGASWDAPLITVGARAVDLLLDLRPRCDARIRAAERLGAVDSESDELRRKALEELSTRLLERRSEITHPDPELAVRIALTAVLGVGEHARTAASEPNDPDSDALRTECLRLVLAYLTGQVRDDAVDFFDVWS